MNIFPSTLKYPVCEVCQIQYQSLLDLNKHMANFHNETDDGRMNRVKQLLLSSRSQGPTIVFSGIKVRNYDCTECGVIFKTLEEQYRHNENQHNSCGGVKSNFDCDKCDNVFQKKYLLVQHRLHVHKN